MTRRAAWSDLRIGFGGDLGGGGVKLNDNGIGFADHEDIRAESDYEEFRVGLGLGRRYEMDKVSLFPRAGIFYRASNEDVEITGITGNGTVDYEYRNDLDSDQIGAEFGVEASVGLTDQVRFFVTPRIELSQVFAEGSSSVDIQLNDMPFASSSVSGIERDFTSFGYGISGGAAWEVNRNVTFTVGGSYRSWEGFTLESEPGEKFSIAPQRFDAWTLGGGIQVNF